MRLSSLITVTLCATVFCACSSSSGHRQKNKLMTGEETAKHAGDSARLAEQNEDTGLLVGSSNDQVEASETKVDAPTTQPVKKIIELKKANKTKTGAQIYAENCSSCHGKDGKGGTTYQWSMRQGPSIKKMGSLADIASVIRDGRVSGGMPAWKRVLSEKELLAVAKYVFDFRTTPQTP